MVNISALLVDYIHQCEEFTDFITKPQRLSWRAIAIDVCRYFYIEIEEDSAAELSKLSFNGNRYQNMKMAEIIYP